MAHVGGRESQSDPQPLHDGHGAFVDSVRELGDAVDGGNWAWWRALSVV